MRPAVDLVDPTVPLGGHDAARTLPNTATSPPNPWPRPSHIGRYLAIEEIGRGGMGVVLRAYDPRLQREVALKSVRADALSEEAETRLVREAQAMAKLTHLNVVGVYDVELVGRTLVIAMEYVRGTTLKRWLAQPRPWTTVLDMFIAAGRGLVAAHAVGLLHRDFKPANVLVGEDGRARVADFGLARSVGHSRGNQTLANAGATTGSDAADFDMTVTGTAWGTPRYMAPEQYGGAVLDPAADQYAFCVALWEALTGQPPFAAARDAAQKLQGPPPWPRDVPVPAAVVRAIRRGLAPMSGDRWPTMDALLGVLVDASRPRHARWWLLSGAVVTMGVAALGSNLYQQHLAERCTGAKLHLEKVWNPRQRDAIQGALSATGVSYAGDVWQRIAPQLDDYAAQWVTMHTDACEASTVLEEQTPEVMDLRMACLQRAKLDLQAVTALLARADAQVAQKAHELVATLPEIGRCEDVEALEAQVPPPAERDRHAVEAIREELAQARALVAAGKYPEAVSRLQPLRERVRAVPYRPLHTEMMMALGQAWEHSDAFAKAEPAFREALRSALASGQRDEGCAAATMLVKVVGHDQARPQEGMAYAQAARGLLAGEGELAEANLRSEIGGVLDILGRGVEAELEHRAAVALAAKFLGPDHLTTARFRGALGLTLKDLGRFPEAEREFQAVLAAYIRNLGSGHPRVALAHGNLGGVLRFQGRLEEAEAAHRKAVEINERALGAEHAATVQERAELAHALYGLGHFKEAEAQWRAALRVRRRTLGPTHQTVLAAQASLVPTLARQGRYKEAEAEARAALATSHETFGPDHPYTGFCHNNLATALRYQGRNREAEPMYRMAIALLVRTRGPDHPMSAYMRNGLGTALEGQGRYVEAEHEQRAVLALLSKTVGDRHPGIVETRSRLGSALRKQKRYREAEAQYRAALALQASVVGVEHPDRADVQLGLAQTLLDAGRAREAVAEFERAWRAWENDDRVAIQSRARLAFGFAQALWTIPAEREHARSLARLAKRRLASTADAVPEDVAAVDAWLRRHG